MNRDPRHRLRSAPDLEPVMHERVYEILGGLDERIVGLEQGQIKAELGQAAIMGKLEDIKATDRHALTKLIVGLATTAITVIAGQRLLAPSAPPAVPPIVRSALDVKLDECRPMRDAGSRAECFSRVFDASTK